MVVRSRLIRRVGRGELPDLGPAYVKLMAFPRFRDRVRYAVRPLPAVHEARMFALVQERVPDVATPPVLAWLGERSLCGPRLSVLVTAALPLSEPPIEPELPRVVRLAHRLADAGVFHPDLHGANTPVLDDGRLALLDLQSVRARRRPLGRRARMRMAEKLAAPGHEGVAAAVAEGGLVDARDAAALEGRARRRALGEIDRRIRRCLTNSTAFRVRRGLAATTYERRGIGEQREVRRGGAELLAAWIGDRVCEVLGGSEPLFGALVRDRLWLGGRCHLYIPRSTDPEVVDQRWPELLQEHRRWRALRAGRETDRRAVDRSVGVP